jgi:hypothetical protein
MHPLRPSCFLDTCSTCIKTSGNLSYPFQIESTEGGPLLSAFNRCCILQRFPSARSSVRGFETLISVVHVTQKAITKETRDDKEERLFGQMRVLEHRYRSADPA